MLLVCFFFGNKIADVLSLKNAVFKKVSDKFLACRMPICVFIYTP